MIRYYKGIYKVDRVSPKSSTGTAMYRALENAEDWKAGALIVIPVRLCHINKKGVD